MTSPRSLGQKAKSLLAVALLLGGMLPAFSQSPALSSSPFLHPHPFGIRLQHQGQSFLGLGILTQAPQLRGLSVAGLLNMSAEARAGVMLAGVANYLPQGSFAGVSIAPLANAYRGRISGLQVSLFNGAREGRGLVQLGVTNGAKRFSGLQLGMISTADQLAGVQLGGFATLVREEATGLQVGAVNVAREAQGLVQLGGINAVAGSFRGLQLGVYNYADQIHAPQIGLVNTAGLSEGGVQIGLVNISREAGTRQVGLINIDPKTRIQLLFGGGTLTRANVALRYRRERSYSQVAIGVGYRAFQGKSSGSIAYHKGLIFPLTSRLSLLGDVGIAHIEDTPLKHLGEANRRYAFAGRLTLEYSFSRLLSAYATGGYAYSRRYQSPSLYRHRPIFEAGITLF